MGLNKVQAEGLCSQYHSLTGMKSVASPKSAAELQTAVNELEKASVAWPDLFSKALRIVGIIMGNDPWESKLAQIFALFSIPVPTPMPSVP